MALESLILLSRTLTRLEVADLAIFSFGSTPRLLHPFESPLTDVEAANVLNEFSFAQEATNTTLLLETGLVFFFPTLLCQPQWFLLFEFRNICFWFFMFFFLTFFHIPPAPLSGRMSRNVVIHG